MCFKISALKNFAIFARKRQCWSLFLIKLQAWRPAFLLKKRLHSRCFSVNIKRFLRTVFLQNTSSSLYFPKFYVMIEWFGRLWAQNWHFYISCFHTKIFSKCTFSTHYNVGFSAILIESLKIRNNSRIIADNQIINKLLQVISCEKCEYEFFENYV